MTGKRRFTQLLCTYLHAHRVILKQIVLERQLEKFNSSAQLEKDEAIKKVLSSTSGGLILLTIADEDVDESETAVAARAASLKAFLEVAEGKPVVIVVSTSWVRAAKLLHAEPGTTPVTLTVDHVKP